MKLKANAGKKQSPQPRHNVVGPEKMAAWPAPCYAFTDWCQCPPTFWKKFHLLQDQTTKPPEILRKPKTNTPSPYPHDPGPPFPTPNLSTAKRSAPTIQIAKGADPMAQIQIQSHPPDSHHKAVPWVMPHTNGLLPDPEIFSGWTAGCWWWDSFSISSISIVYILHPEVSFPVPPRWFSISIKHFELHRVVLVLQMAMFRVDRSLLWTFEFDVFWI